MAGYRNRGKGAKKARVPRKRTVVRKALRKAKSQSIAKVVKRVLNSKAETKIVTKEFSLNPFCLQSTITSLLDNYYPMTPTSGGFYTILTGEDSSERNGNRVSTKRLTLKYILTPSAYSATSNPNLQPTHVRIFFFSYRQEITGILDPNVMNNFFEDGALSQGFSGNLFDLLHKVNKDRFTYLAHRTHKVGWAVNSNSGWTQPTVGSVQTPNNDFKVNVLGSIDLTKFCPKTVIFSDDTSDCISKTIHMVIQVLNANNTTYSTVIQPIKMDAKIQYEYLDM